jgi:hypothetical protein
VFLNVDLSVSPTEYAEWSDRLIVCLDLFIENRRQRNESHHAPVSPPIERTNPTRKSANSRHLKKRVKC